MWTAYAFEAIPESVDLTSAVNNIFQKFDILRRDAEHAIIYDNKLGLLEDFLKDICKRYSNGIEICRDYKENKISIEVLIQQLESIELYDYLEELEKFLPKK